MPTAVESGVALYSIWTMIIACICKGVRQLGMLHTAESGSCLPRKQWGTSQQLRGVQKNFLQHYRGGGGEEKSTGLPFGGLTLGEEGFFWNPLVWTGTVPMKHLNLYSSYNRCHWGGRVAALLPCPYNLQPQGLEPSHFHPLCRERREDLNRSSIW